MCFHIYLQCYLPVRLLLRNGSARHILWLCPKRIRTFCGLQTLFCQSLEITWYFCTCLSKQSSPWVTNSTFLQVVWQWMHYWNLIHKQLNMYLISIRNARLGFPFVIFQVVPHMSSLIKIVGKLFLKSTSNSSILSWLNPLELGSFDDLQPLDDFEFISHSENHERSVLRNFETDDLALHCSDFTLQQKSMVRSKQLSEVSFLSFRWEESFNKNLRGKVRCAGGGSHSERIKWNRKWVAVDSLWILLLVIWPFTLTQFFSLGFNFQSVVHLNWNIVFWDGEKVLNSFLNEQNFYSWIFEAC